MAYQPPKIEKSKKMAISELLEQGVCERKFDKDIPLRMVVIFEFPIPKSWSKKKQAQMDGEYKISRPDVDNLVKHCLDYLNGLAYHDDAQIVEISAKKIYTSGEPCTRIHIVRAV